MKSDKQLKQDVLAELSWDPSITAAHIGVSVNIGVVTLSGHVESLAEKHAAKVAALRVRGVSALVQHIEVRLTFDGMRGDEAVAAAVRDQLAWDSSIPPNAIQVAVENGWVTLTGFLDLRYQKLAAEKVVRRLLGVVGLTNLITVLPQVNALDIREAITNAINRSCMRAPHLITVSVDGGHIHLNGSVSSRHDWRLASAAAWAATGATSVENNLAIVA